MDEKPLWRMVAGRKVGPYDPAKLRPLVKDGRISPLDRFSYDGEAWRPAGEFPELLRSPSAAMTSSLPSPAESNPLDSGLLGSDAPAANFSSVDGIGPADDVLPQTRSQSGSSLDEAQLVKAIYMLIAFGGGMFVLLIGYIIIASLVGGNRPQPAVAAPAPANQPVAQAQPHPEPQAQPVEPGDAVPQPSSPPAVRTDTAGAPPATPPGQGGSGTPASGAGAAPEAVEPAQPFPPVDVPPATTRTEPPSE